MKTEAKFIIANKDKESNAYAREMNRMQVLDRVRQQVVSNTLEASVSQTMEELKRSRTIVHQRLNQQSQDADLFRVGESIVDKTSVNNAR